MSLRYLMIIGLLFLSQLVLPNERQVDTLAVVVPVYREFKTQNIARLLSSLANQEVRPVERLKVEVVLIVNHTVNTDEEIKQENRRTVEYLNEIAKRKMPRLERHQSLLIKAAQDVLQSPLEINLHILDYTDPGFKERNIGRVRNVANQYLLKYLKDQSLLETTIIHQMDADTVVQRNYMKVLKDVFSNPQLAYGILSLRLTHEANSEQRVYQRITVDSSSFHTWEFEAALENKMPVSGTPRIVTRAQVIDKLGGIPELTEGEDRELITLLRERFSGQGEFLYSQSVFTSFRARLDGYDASYNFRRMGDPIQLPTWVVERLEDVAKQEKKITSEFPEIHKMRVDLYKQYVNEHLKLSQSRIETLRFFIDHMIKFRSLPPLAPEYDLFFYSDWLETHLQSKVSQPKATTETILNDFAEEFPYLFSIPLDSITETNMRIRATTMALQTVHNFPQYVHQAGLVAESGQNHNILLREWMNLEINFVRLYWGMKHWEVLIDRLRLASNSNVNFNLSGVLVSIKESLVKKQQELEVEKQEMANRLKSEAPYIYNYLRAMENVFALQKRKTLIHEDVDMVEAFPLLLSIFHKKERFEVSEFFQHLAQQIADLSLSQGAFEWIQWEGQTYSLNKYDINLLKTSLEFLSTGEGGMRSMRYDLLDGQHRSYALVRQPFHPQDHAGTCLETAH